MAGEYIIPLGIDGEKVTAGLNDIVVGIDKVEGKAGEAGKTIEDAFGKGAKAADALDNSLKPTTKNLESIRQAGKNAGDELANAFNIKEAGNKLTDQINGVKKQLATLTEKNKIGIEVDQTAVKDLKAASDFLKQNFDEISGTLNASMSLLDTKIDSAKAGIADMEVYIKDLQTAIDATAPGMAKLDLQQELAATNQALQEEVAALAEYEAQLKQTNDAQNDLNKTLVDAEKAVTLLQQEEIGLNSTFEQVYGSLQPLTTRLGELEDRLYELALAGQQNTEEFRQLQDEAIRYRQTIQQVDASVDTFAKNSAILDITIEAATGLTGAFAAVQGATALLGTESEELNEAILRVNAAMSVLQGIQAVAAVLNKESAISALLFRSATTASTTATVAQTTAVAAHTAAVAAEVVASEALVVAETQLATATAAATAAATAHAAANTAETAAMVAATVAAEAEAVAVVETATAGVASASAATANAAAQVAQAGAMGTATVASKALGIGLKAIGIGLIISLIALLVEYWDDLTEAVNKLLPAGESVGKLFDKIKSYAVGVGNVVFQYLITPFKALTKLLQGDLEGFKNAIVDGLNFKKNFTDGFNKSELSNAKKHAKELEEERIKSDERDLARRKNRGENVEKEEIALQKRRLALQEKDSKDWTKEQEKLEDLQDKAVKNKKDKDKKDADEAKKLREEAEKKRLELEKKNAAAVEKYARDAADIRINAMAEGFAKERAKIEEEYKRKEEDLKKETELTKASQAKQAELITQLIAERDRKIKQVEENSAKEKQKLQLDAQKTFQELAKEGSDRDLKLLDIDHEERKKAIEEQYKDEADLKNKLLVALDASTARERKKIADEAAMKNLQDEEERQLLAIELASKYALKNEETERQKQIAIYETKIEFAQKTLDALTAGGLGETNLQVLQAKAQLKALRDGLQQELKTGSQKPFSFMEFIGLGKLDDDQKAAVQKAGAQAAEALGQITDFIVDQYQRQIDKKQESIDQLDDEIGDLEEKLDEEKELRDNGFANNVELIEAELAEKQRQKDEEVKQQEDLMKKKQAMQKAQMAVDTAVQLVNMITASTEIFKALAGIPFIGIPLAIATIGTMFGAFVVAKVKAAQGISAQQFGEGGWIDGKSHAEGGKKYYSADGDVRELEKDEFVVRKKQAKKYANLLEAINNNSFSGFDVNDAGLKDMLNEMGIDLADDSAKAGLDEANKLGNMKLSITVNNSSNDREMREMNANIKFLADREREKVTTWEDDKYFYSKIGSRTTKVPKFKKEVADATS